MDCESDDSNLFKVDQSQQVDIDKRLQNLFDKDKKILIEGQKRKVIYGTMEEKSRTIYQVIEPYFWKMASATGGAATQAGIGIYNAISNGFVWIYRKFIDEVVPYSKQEIPKLFFIIKKQKNKLEVSDNFEVLEIEDEDYQKIQKKASNGKKRIIIPFDHNAEDPEFIKFMEDQNYVVRNSFPIDLDSQMESESLIIPSGRFSIAHGEALRKNLHFKNSNLEPGMTEQISMRKQSSEKEQVLETNNQQNEQKPIEQIESNQNKVFQQVEDYKKVEKNVFKLKDCYIFELEGKNSIEYDLLDGIERDEQTHVGYLLPLKQVKSNQSQSSNGSDEAEYPLLEEIKKPDTTRNVRVEIPKTCEKKEKVEEKNVEFC